MNDIQVYFVNIKNITNFHAPSINNIKTIQLHKFALVLIFSSCLLTSDFREVCFWNDFCGKGQQFILFFTNQVLQSYYLQMGTIQSKLKAGYSIRPKPLLKKPSQKGSRPTVISQIRKQSSNRFSPFNHGQDLTCDTTDLKKMHSSKEFSKNSIPQLIQNSSVYPYSTIGLISFFIGGQVKYGSGFLIGDNLVLTCAHNLYSAKRSEQAQNIYFTPGYSPNQERQSYKAKIIHYPKQFKANSMNEQEEYDQMMLNDFGIIRLETTIRVDEICGKLGFNFIQQDHEVNNTKLILGYCQHQQSTVALHKLQGKVKLHDKIISYDMQTENGMSGGPIVEILDGEFNVIGIHSYQRRKGRNYERGGLRFNEVMFAQIGQWATQQEQQIDLRDEGLGREGLKQLCKLKWNNSLCSINLARNNIGKDGLKYIARCDWNNLYHLDLGGNNLGKQGVSHLVAANIPNLNSLNLWGNSIGCEGACLLQQSKWQQLTNLNLYNNGLCNQGLTQLVKIEWVQLNNLNLGKNGIDNVGVLILISAHWKNIVSLNLWGNNFKEQKNLSTQIKRNYRKVRFLYL